MSAATAAMFRSAGSASIMNTGQQLAVESASVTIDETWAPYVQATIQVTGDLDKLALVDPRNDITITVLIEHYYEDLDPVSVLSTRFTGATLAAVSAAFAGATLAAVSAPLHRPFAGEPPDVWSLIAEYVLVVRERSIDHLTGTATLTLASEEALLQDDAHIGTAPFNPPGDKLGDLVRYILSRIGRTLTFVSAPVNNNAVPEAMRPWKPGITAFEYIYGHVRAAGAMLWCDENRAWHLDAVRPVTDSPTYIVDAATNLIRPQDSISRDRDWYTAVVITYNWTDANGSHEQYDAAYLTAFPARVYTETRNSPYPGPGAAAAFLANLNRQGRVNELVVLANPVVRPGQLLLTRIPGIPDQFAYASAIAWNYPGDTMTITTKTPA